MAPTFLCACLRIMRERGARQRQRLDGRNPNSAGPAVAETNSIGDTNSAGATNPQSPQSRKLLLLLLLALGHSVGESKDQTGVGMNQTGVGGENTGIGVHIDERNVTTSLELTAVAETFVDSQWQECVGITRSGGKTE